jgi:AraC-like DNA-binding protein
MEADNDQLFPVGAGPAPRLYSAPLRLMSLVRYFHVERAASGPVVLPAVAFPSMCIIVEGGVRLGGPGGLLVTEAFVRGPNQRPVRLEWMPGTSLIVAMLRVGRIGRLFDIPASELANQLLPLEFIINCGDVHRLTDAVRRGVTPRDWMQAIEDWFVERMQAESMARVAPLCLPASVLGEPAEVLAEYANLSLRQFERRFLASYGVSLRETRRLMRHMLAMATMLRTTPRRGQLTAVAHEAGYYDQAQMVREFSELSNMTPSACFRAMYGDVAQEDESRLLRYTGNDRQLVITSPL